MSINISRRMLVAAAAFGAAWAGSAQALTFTEVEHGIDDVRHLLSGDPRFLEQF